MTCSEIGGLGAVNSYRLHVEAPSLYLVPADPGGQAVRITGVAVEPSASAQAPATRRDGLLESRGSRSQEAEAVADQRPVSVASVASVGSVSDYARAAPGFGGVPAGVSWTRARWAQSWLLRFGSPVETLHGALLAAGDGSLTVGNEVVEDVGALRWALRARAGVAEPSADALSGAAERLGMSVLVLRGDGSTGAYGHGPALVVAEAESVEAGAGRTWMGLSTASTGPALGGLSAAQLHRAVTEGQRFVGPRGGGFFDALAATGRASGVPELDQDPQRLRTTLV